MTNTKEIIEDELGKVTGGLIADDEAEREEVDKALRRFKKGGDSNNTIEELRKREHYENPSVKRRKKSEAARKRSY